MTFDNFNGDLGSSLGFQEAATTAMESLVEVHHYMWFFLTLVTFTVLWMLLSILFIFWYKQRYPTLTWGSIEQRKEIFTNIKVSHGSKLEIYWTMLPTLILFLIGLPSFILLYSIEFPDNPDITFKIIGHQWYWSYESSDIKDIKTGYIYDTNINKIKSFQNLQIYSSLNFDSNLVYEDELFKGEHRLLQVDSPFIIPKHATIRILVTSDDVLHSWAVPAFGIKIDAVPGRLNQGTFAVERDGIFYGQCSELCGVNHGFMPIEVRSTDIETFNYAIHKKPVSSIDFIENL